jgi:methylmalonyl-CoA mutase, C-terminal domain
MARAETSPGAQAPMNQNKRWRVLTAKVGLDGHDRGVKVVSRALRDAGVEVIYAGLRQTPEMVVEAAIQEDVDAIGVSLHSGAHMTLIPRILELLKERDASDIVIFGGGIIPQDDATELKRMGVVEIFGPGSSLQSIIDFVNHGFKAA